MSPVRPKLCVNLLLIRPNVGGVVGLADLYVDRALGFSMGWAAWVSSHYEKMTSVDLNIRIVQLVCHPA